MGWVCKEPPGKTEAIGFGSLAVMVDLPPLSPGALTLGLKSLCFPST